MTPRDRTVITVVASLVILAAAWFLVVAPVRDEAKSFDDKLAAAQARVAVSQATVGSGEAAKGTYRRDYAAVARLGKAVPDDDDIPSLVVQLEAAAKRSRVDFRSIELATSGTPAGPPAVATTGAQVAALANEQNGGPATGASGTSGASGPTGPAAANAAANQAAAAALPPGTVVGEAGFPTMPFNFAFNGSFFRLQDFLGRLDRFTEIDGTKVTVRGRLLTVDGFSLGASPKGFPNMTATISATGYLLPGQQGLLAGANPLTPAASIPPSAAGPPPGEPASNPPAGSAPVPSAAVPAGGPTP